MFNILCSFDVSSLLEKRGFNEYVSERGILIEKWYDSYGNISLCPTSYPIVGYNAIFRWLFDHHIYIFFIPTADSENFMGRIFELTEITDESGRPLIRPCGGYSMGPSYELTYAMTLRRAIYEVPVSVSDDDLPF